MYRLESIHETLTHETNKRDESVNFKVKAFIKPSYRESKRQNNLSRNWNNLIKQFFYVDSQHKSRKHKIMELIGNKKIIINIINNIINHGKFQHLLQNVRKSKV